MTCPPDALAVGHGALPTASEWPGLNEYDSEVAIRAIRAIHPEPLTAADSPEVYCGHFRLLRQGLQASMDGRTAPASMPSDGDFVAGINAALDHVHSSHAGKVRIVSSGGPTTANTTAVGQLLGTSVETVIEIKLRIRNSAVTELSFTPKRQVLLSFNHLPHLEAAARRDGVSYS